MSEDNQAKEEVVQSPSEKRASRNAGMSKGYAVIGMRKVKLAELIKECGDDVDIDVFTLAIGLDEHCRTDIDVKSVMKERNIIGTIYPMRNMKPVTQSEQTVTMFS